MRSRTVLNIKIEVDTREVRQLFFEYASKLCEARGLYLFDDELFELTNGDKDEFEEKIYKEFERELACCIDYR